VAGTTYGLDLLPIGIRSTHLAVKLVSQTTGVQRVARVVVHYEDGAKDNKN